MEIQVLRRYPMKKGGFGPLFLCQDPLSFLGEKVNEEVAAQVIWGCEESPAPVDLGNLLDKLH
jgi:hypothetical protein